MDSTVDTKLFSQKGLNYLQLAENVKNGLLKEGKLNAIHIHGLAVDILQIDGDEKELVVENVWTQSFIDLLLNAMLAKEDFWPMILIAIGNSISHPLQTVPDRLVNTSSFILMLKLFLSGEDPDSLNPTLIAKTPQESAAWILSNILQQEEGKVPVQILDLIPFLLQHIALEDNGSKQLVTPCFRCLCAIFSIPRNRRDYSMEYENFLELTRNKKLIVLLLEEYQYGLRGKSLPNTRFFPVAFQRALSVQYLLRIPELQDILVECKVIPILTKSLSITFDRSEKETPMLWSRAVKSLHHLTRSRKFNEVLANDKMIGILANVATGRYYENSITPRVPTPMKVRQLAADIVVALGIQWELQRLFWIARKKEQPRECFIGNLPIELLRSIMKWFVILGGLSDPANDTIRVVNIAYKH